LLPGTVAELKRLGIKVKEAAFDAGFLRDKTEQLLQAVSVFIVGTDNAGSRRTRRRLTRYRVGAERAYLPHETRIRRRAQPAQKATKAPTSGKPGAPWPTTWTPSPP
jgi:hypothetical protein